jgi:riboflavin synthase alpha subunit
VIFLFAVQTFWLRVFNQQLSSISNTHNFVVITVKQKFAITLVKISLKRFQAKTTKPGERFQVEHRRETQDVQRAAGQGQKGSRRDRGK